MRRSGVGVASALLLIAAGCSSGASDASGGESALDQQSTPTADSADAAATPSAETIPDATDVAVASGVFVVETDNGRSWTSEDFTCSYTPKNTTPYSMVWSARATLPTGGEFDVFLTNSPDPASDDTILIGNIVDDSAGIAYVAIEATAASKDSTLTLTIGMHDNPLKTVGDPIDLTAVVTCPLS